MIRHETHAATVVLVGTVVQIALFGHPTRPDLTMKNKRLWTGTKLAIPTHRGKLPCEQAILFVSGRIERYAIQALIFPVVSDLAEMTVRERRRLSARWQVAANHMDAPLRAVGAARRHDAPFRHAAVGVDRRQESEPSDESLALSDRV